MRACNTTQTRFVPHFYSLETKQRVCAVLCLSHFRDNSDACDPVSHLSLTIMDHAVKIVAPCFVLPFSFKLFFMSAMGRDHRGILPSHGYGVISP